MSEYLVLVLTIFNEGGYLTFKSIFYMIYCIQNQAKIVV